MDFYIVDVFAEKKYQGNQLAVFVPDESLSGKEMLQIAKEMNFSETSFILSSKQKNGGYDVRIFTPDVEVPFAGHPTLGTAAVIDRVMEGGQGSNVILNLPVGQIPVDIAGSILTMRQNQPAFGTVIDGYQLVADSLSIDISDIQTDYPIQKVSTGLPCIIVPLKSIDAMSRCRIDHHKFRMFLDTYGYCNLLVFADESQLSGDLRVRVFMDDTGFFEDPATGSANGNLAAYLLKHQYFEKDNISIIVNQGVEMKRPSRLEVAAVLERESFDIRVGGKVQFISSGAWV